VPTGVTFLWGSEVGKHRRWEVVAGAHTIAKAIAGSVPTDSALVKRCLRGDQEAWAALLERYKRLIFSVPLRNGLNRDEAADVFQSVCLDLLNGLPQLRAAKALPKWLMQASYHHTLRYLRQQRSTVGPIPAQEASSDEIPEALAQELERAQVLRNAITHLPQRCAELIRMLFFAVPARPYEEVARQLSLSTGSIGFIRGRCLDRLRRELEKAGFK
jgi:RNA polymerase sigma factor (sigma-70 family)